MATIYIAQTALGANNGTTAADARPISWLNTASNWNGAAGTVCATATAATVRDKIIWVGEISTPFDWPYATGVGAAGIDFEFDPNARFVAAHWGGGTRGAAIFWESAAYQKNNVTIDFGLNGRIEATDNGTLLGNQQGGVGIYIKSASNVTIKKPRIWNLYVRTSGWHEGQQSTDGRNTTGIFLETNTGAATDFIVEDGNIHDCDKGIIANWLSAGCARYTFRRNEIYNVNWGIGSGGYGNGSTLTGFHAYENWIHDFACWDRPAYTEDDPFHHNGIFLYAEPMPSGTQPNFLDAIAERNHIGPNLGTRATSGIYLSHYNMRGAYDVRNNVFEGSSSNGLITVGIGSAAVLRIMNNVFMMDSSTNAAMSLGGSYSGSGFSIISKNNIVVGGQLYSGNYVNGTPYVPPSPGPERAEQFGFTLTSDNNLVIGYDTAPVNWSTTNSYVPTSWATWQGMGHDAHGIVDSNPLLDSNGRPGTGSPALNAGADLSAFFTNDYEGTTRVAPWDMGAFEGASTPAAPNFITQPISQTVYSGDDVTLTAVATGSPAPTYQWRQGGENLSGETSSVLALDNLTTGGVFDCVATNSEGTATSDEAVVTVLAPGGLPSSNPIRSARFPQRALIRAL